MNLRKNSKVWIALAEASENPSDFIRSVMQLRGETPTTLAEKMNHTPMYVSVALANKTIGVTGCLNFATALNIDPYLLCRVLYEYKMKCLIEKREKEQSET